eukprot:s3632_g4.t1
MSWVSSIAVLQDGGLIAITAKIWEACSGCNYDSHIVSGLLRVNNLEELAARAPGFYEAMTLPISHERHTQPEAGATEPLGRGRSWIGSIGNGWNVGCRLRDWQEARGHGKPTTRGWADFELPSKRFTNAWAMPEECSLAHNPSPAEKGLDSLSRTSNEVCRLSPQALGKSRPRHSSG